MNEFLPIILGTDSNAYGMARSFHEEYNVVSLVIGKLQLLDTKESKILKANIFPNLDNEFLNILSDIYSEYKSKYEKLILISCSDGYTSLILENKEELSDMFIIPYINSDLKEKLENKEEFYKMCEEHNLDYPKTLVVSKNKTKDLNIPFDFPIIIKASNSITYLSAEIQNKKKAYKANNIEEAKEIIKNIYKSKYTDNLIIQEYIPGSDKNMYVLNSYSDKNKKVNTMTLGNVLVEDCAPYFIGNFNAIKTVYNKELYKKIEDFLNNINYTGYSNFDIKYDYRDKKYKLFEINIRQGRSSYYVTEAGNNLAKSIVDDYIYNKKNKPVYNSKKAFWSYIPKFLVYKSISKSEKKYLKELVKDDKYGRTLFYKKDLSFKRLLVLVKIEMMLIKSYYTHYDKENIDV